MAFFNTELENEYKTSTRLKKYTTPKIFKGGKKNNAWYVYYSYQHPTDLTKQGLPKFVRFKVPTMGINRKYKTKEERLIHFNALRDATENLLKRGLSPFDDNVLSSNETISSEKAIDYALSIKKMHVSEKTYNDYYYRANSFKKFIDKRGFLITDVKHITRPLIMQFLNETMKTSSAANRNNNRAALSALFSVLKNEEIVNENYFNGIANIKTKPKAHQIFTDKQAKDILKAIDDETLLRYIKIVGMGFIRPVEACRLQIKDIDFNNKVWSINSKTKVGKRKRIPDLLFKEIEPFKNYDLNCYLITNDSVALSNLNAEQRRATFSKKHTKILKKLGLTDNYDTYSWRHYYTNKVLQELLKTYTFYKALDILQEITGHTTRTALMKYLRSIEAVITDDYSKYLK